MSNNSSWADGLEDELNFWNNWVKIEVKNSLKILNLDLIQLVK